MAMRHPRRLARRRGVRRSGPSGCTSRACSSRAACARTRRATASAEAACGARAAAMRAGARQEPTARGSRACTRSTWHSTQRAAAALAAGAGSLALCYMLRVSVVRASRATAAALGARLQSTFFTLALARSRHHRFLARRRHHRFLSG
eukprot:7098869-Prymnesium_polylepis.2